MDAERRKFRISVEPILFSYVFTGALCDSVIANLLLRQVCWYDLSLPLEECTDESHIEDKVHAQKLASTIEVYKMLIETVLPAFLSLFIGAWSDSNGRKIIMIIPLIGHVITYCTWACLSLIRDLNPIYLLFSSLGVLFSGGFVTVYIACFCYLADITTDENRVVRMGIAEAAINIGQLTGFLAAPYLFLSIENGYWLVFVTIIAILTLNIVYVMFLPETVNVAPEEKKNLFRLQHLKDMAKAVAKERPNYGRPIIFLVCFVSFLSLFTIWGESGVKYFSTMLAFHWQIKEFNIFNSITLGAVFAASSIGLWFGKSILKFSDPSLLMISILTRGLSGILMAISATPSFFYFATIVGSFKSFTGPLVRSQLSEIVVQNDIGKVFSFLSSMEAVTPQAAGPLYMKLYSAINGTFPLGIYLLSTIVFSIAALVVGVIVILKKMAVERSYQSPPPDEESE